MRTEFLFDRPSPRSNPAYIANIERIEQVMLAGRQKPVDHAAIDEFTRSIGELGTEALAHWSLIAQRASTGQSVAMDAVIDAAILLAVYSEGYDPFVGDDSRNRATAGLVMTADLTAERARNPQVKAVAALCSDHIKLLSEANAGNVVFRDSYLLISWRSNFGRERPELYACVRNSVTGLWTWLPPAATKAVGMGDNVEPPLSSFRAARKTIATWKGQSLVGELAGSTAIRFCRLLGIEVQGDKGIIHRSRR